MKVFHFSSILQKTRTFLNHISPSIRCHLSNRLISYDEIPESGGSLRLVFENGNTATCDLLIGVEGIKSIVRKKFVADHYSMESVKPHMPIRCGVELSHIAVRSKASRYIKTPPTRGLYDQGQEFIISKLGKFQFGHVAPTNLSQPFDDLTTARSCM